MLEQGDVPLDIKRVEADGGRTVVHRTRHPLDETTYDTTDDDKGLHKVPKSLLSAVYSLVAKHRKMKCVNKHEDEHYGRRYVACPVPPDRRFGRDRSEPPWDCGYCRLFDDPWKEEGSK